MIPALILASLAAAAVPMDPPAAIPLPQVAKAEPAPELDKLFRRTDGWVGGDGAFSVPISDKRTLWLFSDTWVGTVREGKREKVSMVNNTVGIQDGNGADAKITFAIAKGKDDKPGTLFVPPDGKGWFWQFAGYHADGKLHIFLPRQEKTKDAGAFGFRNVDVWLATIENPTDDPTKWRPTYAKVPFAEFAPERKRSFGSAVLRVENHVHIYGYEEKPGKPFASRKLLVARAPADKLADFDSWRFLGANGEWKADAKDAVGLADGLGTEFSVTYLPGLKKCALVYTENGLSDRIVGRFAESPTGPWSEPVLLYKCPEMKANKKVFTYAAKAHPQLADDNELVISYVVNSFELGPVINDADLYWPRFVRVALK
jgi:Domain of unknown function (DUF4185)/Domain of unknown function (DUF5005)